MKIAISSVVIGLVVVTFGFGGGTAQNFADLQSKRTAQIEQATK